MSRSAASPPPRRAGVHDPPRHRLPAAAGESAPLSGRGQREGMKKRREKRDVLLRPVGSLGPKVRRTRECSRFIQRSQPPVFPFSLTSSLKFRSANKCHQKTLDEVTERAVPGQKKKRGEGGNPLFKLKLQLKVARRWFAFMQIANGSFLPVSLRNKAEESVVPL